MPNVPSLSSLSALLSIHLSNICKQIYLDSSPKRHFIFAVRSLHYKLDTQTTSLFPSTRFLKWTSVIKTDKRCIADIPHGRLNIESCDALLRLVCTSSSSKPLQHICGTNLKLGKYIFPRSLLSTEHWSV